MRHAKGLLKGKKINGRHSSVIDAAQIVVKTAKADDRVFKIVIGIITRISGGPHRLAIRKIQAGLSVKVRGGNCVQQLYVYTNEPDAVAHALEDVWEYA